MRGKVPFPDKKMYSQISYSENFVNIVNALCDKNPTTRLGYGKDGYKRILQHPWFADVNINDIFQRKVDAPYKPASGGDIKEIWNAEVANNLAESAVSKKI